MFFDRSHLKSKKLAIEGLQESVTLFEVTALERMQILDKWSSIKTDDPNKYENDFDSSVHLVCCSLKPGIENFDFEKNKEEIKALPDRIFQQLYKEALILSGFEVQTNKEDDKPGK